jgi:putative transferase (TIGR04331 family)
MRIKFKKNFLEHSVYNFQDIFRRSEIKNKIFSKYSHPWNNILRKKKQINLYRHLEKKIISELGFFLDKEIKQKNSYQYWLVILGPWCSKFITSILEVNSILSDIRLKKIISFDVPVISIKEFIPNNYMDFAQRCNEDYFRNFLAGLFLQLSDNKHIVFKKKKIKKNLIIQKSNKLIYIFIYKLYFFFIKLFFKNFIIVSSLSFSSFVTAFIKNKKIPIFLTKKINYNKLFLKKRLKFKLYLKLKNKYLETVINQALPYCLPKNYLENYSEICEYVKKIIIPNSTITSDGQHLHDDICKFFIANLKKNHSNVFNIIQHGGGYQCKFHSMHNYEMKISDQFFSWGKPFFKKEIQIFSPHIKSFFNISKRETNRIIIPLYNPSIYNQNMTTLIGGKQYEKIYKDLLLFLENLVPDLQSIVNLRFAKNGNILDYQYFFKKKFKRMNVYQGEDTFKNELISHNICICNTYATTLLQAYASNIPVIFFWRDGKYILREETKSLFFKMKKNNLYFSNPILAAKFINKNYYNIDKWWKTKKIQSISNEFRNFFCFPS